MPQRRNGNPPDKARPSPDKPINRLTNLAQQTAGNVGQAASDALSAASQKADDLAASLGGSMQALAGNLRAAAPSQESLGQLASGVAEALERSGRFLQQEGISGLTNELAQLIRRNPLPAVCIAAGLGFLLAQTRR